MLVESYRMEFSLPIALIGEPQSDWLYFVATGIQAHYGGDVAMARLQAAQESASRFAPGGGSSDRQPQAALFDVLLPAELDQPALLNGRTPMTMLGSMNTH